MLRLAKCEIISSMTNSEISAYVLSESSMFISKRRFILKTCGTTTPLDCIEALTKLVLEFAMFDTVEVCNIVSVTWGKNHLLSLSSNWRFESHRDE